MVRRTAEPLRLPFCTLVRGLRFEEEPSPWCFEPRAARERERQRLRVELAASDMELSQCGVSARILRLPIAVLEAS
jgi:hypothetical protein